MRSSSVLVLAGVLSICCSEPDFQQEEETGREGRRKGERERSSRGKSTWLVLRTNPRQSRNCFHF